MRLVERAQYSRELLALAMAITANLVANSLRMPPLWPSLVLLFLFLLWMRSGASETGWHGAEPRIDQPGRLAQRDRLFQRADTIWRRLQGTSALGGRGDLPVPRLVSAPDTASGRHPAPSSPVDLHAVVGCLERGRSLTFMGPKAAGKTTTLARLAVLLMERRSGRCPVPALFDLSSYVAGRPLRELLVDQLTRECGLGRRMAKALVDHGQTSLLPFLDNLNQHRGNSRSVGRRDERWCAACRSPWPSPP
jgi:hypothetical protein